MGYCLWYNSEAGWKSAVKTDKNLLFIPKRGRREWQLISWVVCLGTVCDVPVPLRFVQRVPFSKTALASKQLIYNWETAFRGLSVCSESVNLQWDKALSENKQGLNWAHLMKESNALICKEVLRLQVMQVCHNIAVAAS